MLKRVVILGAGIGGRLAARGIKDKFPEVEVVLVGPEDKNERPGLFYFNHKIPGICEREIDVTYGLVGEGTMKDYQIKSRGYFDSSMVKSSFKNVGQTVKGYLVNKEISLDGVVRVVGSVTQVTSKDNLIWIDGFSSPVKFDYLISTIPLSAFLKIFYTEDGKTFQVSKEEFKSTPVYQKVAGYQKVPDCHIDSIKVFYDLSNSEFYRHSSYYHGDIITRMVSESIQEFEDPDIVAYPGKITPSRKLTELVEYLESQFDNLKICGRYARWDYHYLVDQTYYDSVQFLMSKT